MTSKDYIRILIIGYREYTDNLSKYLIRQSKKAEEEFIDPEEFFEGLNKVIKLFHTDIDNQYYKRKNDVSIIKSIREEKGQSIEDLEGQLFPKENYNVFLPRVTGNLFTGNLPFQDLLLLESEIYIAQELISIEGTQEKLAKAIDVLNNYSTKKNEAEKLDKQIHKSDLSAFEIALQHYYLYLAKKENFTSRQIAEMYKGVKAPKNIEMAYNDLLEKRKKGNKSQLKKVHDSLTEYPDIQKAIQNDIDKLN